MEAQSETSVESATYLTIDEFQFDLANLNSTAGGPDYSIANGACAIVHRMMATAMPDLVNQAVYERLLPRINGKNRLCDLRAAKAVMKEVQVIASEFCRHPLAPSQPEIRATTLNMAAELDPTALTWAT